MKKCAHGTIKDILPPVDGCTVEVMVLVRV